MVATIHPYTHSPSQVLLLPVSGYIYTMVTKATPQSSRRVSPTRGENSPDESQKQKQRPDGHLRTMAWISLPLVAVLAGMQLQSVMNPTTVAVQAQELPAQAQVIDQKSFNGMINLHDSSRRLTADAYETR